MSEEVYGLVPGHKFEGLPIETAPKDGTLIIVGDPDVGDFPMQWGHIQRNGLFPGLTGMWVAQDGSFTWQDADDFGPSYWRPLTPPSEVTP